MSEIMLPSKDKGSFMAYVAMPDKLPAPTILVIQEIFGVNAGLRRKCDELAKAGYIAVCPDLFWRLEPGVQLSDKTPEEWKKALDLMNRFDIDKGIEDLRVAEHTFKGHAESTGKVGCVGYCLGGKLAYLAAARISVDCAISYYGVGIETMLGEATNIQCPTMLHIAEEDKYTPPPTRKKIIDGLAGHKNIVIHTYPGADHAFARVGGEHYNEEAATLANQRTMNFLQSSLRQAKAA